MKWNDHKGKVPQHLLDAHRDFATIGVDRDVEGGFLRMVALIEARKRGVRFLPAQVITRALRKLKNPSTTSQS